MLMSDLLFLGETMVAVDLETVAASSLRQSLDIWGPQSHHEFMLALWLQPGI